MSPWGSLMIGTTFFLPKLQKASNRVATEFYGGEDFAVCGVPGLQDCAIGSAATPEPSAWTLEAQTALSFRRQWGICSSPRWTQLWWRSPQVGVVQFFFHTKGSPPRKFHAAETFRQVVCQGCLLREVYSWLLGNICLIRPPSSPSTGVGTSLASPTLGCRFASKSFSFFPCQDHAHRFGSLAIPNRMKGWGCSFFLLSQGFLHMSIDCWQPGVHKKVLKIWRKSQQVKANLGKRKSPSGKWKFKTFWTHLLRLCVDIPAVVFPRKGIKGNQFFYSPSSLGRLAFAFFIQTNLT